MREPLLEPERLGVLGRDTGVAEPFILLLSGPAEDADTFMPPGCPGITPRALTWKKRGVDEPKDVCLDCCRLPSRLSGRTRAVSIAECAGVGWPRSVFLCGV